MINSFKHLVSYTEQLNTSFISASLSVPFPLPDSDDQPYLPVRRNGTELPFDSKDRVQPAYHDLTTKQVGTDITNTSCLATESLTPSEEVRLSSMSGSASTSCNSATRGCPLGGSVIYDCSKCSAHRSLCPSIPDLRETSVVWRRRLEAKPDLEKYVGDHLHRNAFWRL